MSIQLLFIISLVTLPVVLYLRSARGMRLIDKIASWLAHPGGIFLFVIPLAIIRVGLMWIPTTSGQAWAEFLWYACYFLYGFSLASDERFAEAIKKNGWVGLALWFWRLRLASSGQAG